MSEQFYRVRWSLTLLLLGVALLPGCFGSRGLKEIQTRPYTVTYEDDSSARFGDGEDKVFIEVRRAKLPRALDNLAIHYQAFFPSGEIIRPGDVEEYVKIDGRNAYKVVFRTTYIRPRKLPKGPLDKEKIPEGWEVRNIVDPLSGKPIDVLYGPIIPRERMLYLVEGNKYLYYIFLRADGDAVDSAKKKFEEFVSKQIKYQ
jgi:hypothetical protein